MDSAATPNLQEQLIDAISYCKWQSLEDLAMKVGVSKLKVSAEMKKLRERYDIDTETFGKTKKYRYENASAT